MPPPRELQNVTHVSRGPTWATFFMTVMENVTHVARSRTWVTFFR
jgi:hypothetical protein